MVDNNCSEGYRKIDYFILHHINYIFFSYYLYSSSVALEEKSKLFSSEGPSKSINHNPTFLQFRLVWVKKKSVM